MTEASGLLIMTTMRSRNALSALGFAALLVACGASDVEPKGAGGGGGAGGEGGETTGTGSASVGGSGAAGGQGGSGGSGGAGGEGGTGGAGGDEQAAVAPDFSLLDANPSSLTHGEAVSPRDYLEQVSGWYFGHAT